MADLPPPPPPTKTMAPKKKAKYEQFFADKEAIEKVKAGAIASIPFDKDEPQVRRRSQDARADLMISLHSSIRHSASTSLTCCRLASRLIISLASSAQPTPVFLPARKPSGGERASSTLTSRRSITAKNHSSSALSNQSYRAQPMKMVLSAGCANARV